MASDQEINRKRKSDHDFQLPRRYSEDEDNDLLNLSLSFRPTRPRRLSPPLPLPSPPPPPPQLSIQEILSPPPQPLPPPLHLFTSYPLYTSSFSPPPEPTPSSTHIAGVHHSRPLKTRRNPTQVPKQGKNDTVPAPFPWATIHRATVHSLEYLLSNQISEISGEVQCKRCEHHYDLEFKLTEKFFEIGHFVAEHKDTLRHRAPPVWMNPVLPTCRFCRQENSVKPIISEKKKSINWLFLLLGQMLGCCTLEQLKYFCKHTKNHRTGAKDRVLYLTYLGLCKQLDPNGPFDL